MSLGGFVKIPTNLGSRSNAQKTCSRCHEPPCRTWQFNGEKYLMCGFALEKWIPGKHIHPWYKKDYFTRKYIFQPLIFRGHVSCPGSTPLKFNMLQLKIRCWEKRNHHFQVEKERVIWVSISIPNFQVCDGFKHVLFSPRKLGKIPILTKIFQMGWNHQLVYGGFLKWWVSQQTHAFSY